MLAHTSNLGTTRRAWLHQVVATTAWLATGRLGAQTPAPLLAAEWRARFGLEGDGLADDTAALQRALDTYQQKTLTLPAGMYRIGAPGLVLRNGTRLIGSPGTVILASGSERYAALNIESGSAGIEIIGLQLLGSWHEQRFPAPPSEQARRAIWESSLAESIGINIQGIWHSREVRKDAAPVTTTLKPSRALTIADCDIRGFGQSGVLADLIDGFTFTRNQISHCGRDGLRMYGVLDGLVQDNQVSDLLFGYGGAEPYFNVYGITATRVYGSRNLPDPDCTIGRCSRRVMIRNNVVRNASTWKSLDTHGGQQISFVGNTCHGSHIGVGIDMGGGDAVRGYAPPIDILVDSNTITAGNSLPEYRAGVTCYGHDGTERNIGRNISVTRNQITGYGGLKTDGAISASNQINLIVSDNTIVDSLRAGICLTNRIVTARIENNRISNVKPSPFGVSYGILVQTSETNASICTNTINQPAAAVPLTRHIVVRAGQQDLTAKVCNNNTLTGPSSVRLPERLPSTPR